MEHRKQLFWKRFDALCSIALCTPSTEAETAAEIALDAALEYGCIQIGQGLSTERAKFHLRARLWCLMRYRAQERKSRAYQGQSIPCYKCMGNYSFEDFRTLRCISLRNANPSEYP